MITDNWCAAGLRAVLVSILVAMLAGQQASSRMGRVRQAASAPILVLCAVLLWLPRLGGPIDLRYDAGVYYVLGTSLAAGSGYRLLNEPGAIRAIQYPPLLPAVAAVHQLLAGTADVAIAGHW